MLTNPAEAADALSAMHTSNARLAKAATCPPERHLAFAALMAVYIGCPAAPVWAMLALEVAILVAVVAVIRWDKRRTGMFISSYRRGRTRPVIAALLAAMLSLYAVGYWCAKARGLYGVPLLLSPVGAVLGFYGSRWWQRVYVRELEARA